MKTFYNVISLAFFITFTCPSGYATDKFAEMNTYINSNKPTIGEYTLEKKEGGKYLLTLKSGNTISHTILFTVNGGNAYLEKILKVNKTGMKSETMLDFFNKMMDDLNVNNIQLHVVPENIIIGETSERPNAALARIYWEAGYNFNWNEAGAKSLYPVLKTFYKTFCPTVKDENGLTNELLKNSNVLVYLKIQNISEELNKAANQIELTGKTTQERTEIKERQKTNKIFTNIDQAAEISMARTKGTNFRPFEQKNQAACWESNKSLKILGFTPKESSQ